MTWLRAGEALELLPEFTYGRLIRVAENGEIRTFRPSPRSHRFYLRADVVKMAKAMAATR